MSEKTKELTNELSEMSRKETSYQGSLARALSKAAQAERREVRASRKLGGMCGVRCFEPPDEIS